MRLNHQNATIQNPITYDGIVLSPGMTTDDMRNSIVDILYWHLGLP
jgi:hypothetical protein